jgi:hypothetical protein
MDPYLEEPDSWPDVHHSLLSTIRERLAAAVSPHFYVRVEERVYVTDMLTDRGYEQFVPDVVVMQGRPVPPPKLKPADAAWAQRLVKKWIEQRSNSIKLNPVGFDLARSGG